MSKQYKVVISQPSPAHWVWGLVKLEYITIDTTDILYAINKNDNHNHIVRCGKVIKINQMATTVCTINTKDYSSIVLKMIQQ